MYWRPLSKVSTLAAALGDKLPCKHCMEDDCKICVAVKQYLLQWEEVAPQPELRAELVNGAVNADVLRERLQSHAEATPSGDSFQSTFESPASWSTGQSR